MNVSDLGEFGLIDRLTKLLGAEASPDLIVGPGDDAAVWRAGDQFLIATTDTMVEGVHFSPEFGTWADMLSTALPTNLTDVAEGVGTWADVGWKSLATNLSDIAAMGGSPLFALVTLALTGDTPAESLDYLYAGLGDCVKAYGVAIAGGDVVRANDVAITVAVLGRAAVDDQGRPLLLRRNAARPGDAIAVTGTLGDSAAGLRRLGEGATTRDALTTRHLRPQPRLAHGQSAIHGGIRCGIDVSDGLLQDVGHICEMSEVTATLRADDIPLSKGLRNAYPDDALELACTGGEDYELVLVGPRDALERIDGVTIIGEITSGPPRVTLTGEDGREITFKRPGWDAFRS